MTKLVTVNTAQQTLTLSNTVYLALSNVVSIISGSVSNTNLELLACAYLSQGLRQTADNRISPGQITTAGIITSYLEGTLKPNSE